MLCCFVKFSQVQYSGTLLIWSPMDPKKLAVLTGWLYDWGKVKFQDKGPK